MNCNQAQEDIVLAVYGELPDDRAHRLDQHLAHCEHCRQEMNAVAALHTTMSLLPEVEPSPSLLARTRVRLDEALDALPQGGFFRRAAQAFRRGLGRLQAAPAMASALLLVGLAGGAWGGYHAGVRAAANQAAAQYPEESQPAANANVQPAVENLDNSRIAAVSNISVDPDSENVEVQFLRLVPDTVFGSLDDARIRQLLVLGARNRSNPAVRNSSVNLLARECQAGHSCTGGPIRNTLMVALRYDRDPGVRARALEGLEPYIAIDTRVRDAILESLLHDPDPAVRSQAIGVLAPVDADSSVREVLQTLASQDQNQHIRTVSRQFLEQVSQVQ